MIAYVQGRLHEIWDKSCLILTPGGVGYRLILPAHTHADLPATGSEAGFYTSMAVREDAIELFGFATFEERQTFEILRAINKIGARTALAVLSTYRPGELKRIIADENINALIRVPGIGKKTAQHVYLELKYKLSGLESVQAGGGGAPAGGILADLVAALANLGYEEAECVDLGRDILKAEPDLDLGGAIRVALKRLAKGKF